MVKMDTTRHFLRTVLSKGFDPVDVRSAVETPERITDVLAHPGQTRRIGKGVAVVGILDPETNTFRCLTAYVDGLMTPPRPDQMNTPEGRRYSERFAAGLGRN